MKSKFFSYFRPTEEYLKKHWDNAVFVFDTNVLINMYRYSKTSRNALKTAMESFNDRVFLPHHVAKEYIKNRLPEVYFQADEYNKLTKNLNNNVSFLENSNKHPFVSEDLLSELKKIYDKLYIELEKNKKELLGIMRDDEMLDFFGNVFDGRTGDGYETEALKELEACGDLRFKDKIPPGYEDAKKDQNKYGDLIVWRQIIDYSKDKNKPIIFVTNDNKEDWWLIQSGLTIGPRPELIDEFKTETGNDFWMYSSSRFLEYYSERNNLRIDQKVIDEVENISTYSSEGIYKNYNSYYHAHISESPHNNPASNFFLTTPLTDLKQAKLLSQKMEKPLFAVFYDGFHPNESKLKYALGYFMEYSTTKKLVDDFFIVALVDINTLKSEDDFSISHEMLEHCYIDVYSPAGNLIYTENVYANPDEGLKRVKSIISSL